MKFSAILTVAMLSANVSVADEIQGVWSSAEGCERLERMKTNPDAAWEGNFIEISYLSKKGIVGYEWGCDFLDTKTNDYGLNVHVSSCSYGPDSWPELLMSKFNNDAGWTIVVSEDNGTLSEEYYPVRCSK